MASSPDFVPENLLFPGWCHFVSGLKYENAVWMSPFERAIE
jgi:hypothetical protein